MNVAIISGASRGLGAALVHACQGTFDRIIAMVREEPPDTAAASPVVFVTADLSDPNGVFDSELERCVPRSASRIVFFSNAATLGAIAPAEGLTAAMFANAAAVNVFAPVHITSWLINRFSANLDRLHLVNITSGAAQRPIAGWSVYCSTKAATLMYFSCVKVEHPEVRVDHFDPGVMDTGMQAAIRAAGPEMMPDYPAFLDLYERAQLQKPEDVADRLLRELV